MPEILNNFQMAHTGQGGKKKMFDSFAEFFVFEGHRFHICLRMGPLGLTHIHVFDWLAR